VGLSEILADPDALDARAVYADELVERHDPRGELIQLQLAGEIARADRLLGRHFRRWFGWPARVCVRDGFAEGLAVAETALFDEIAAVEPVTRLEIDDPPLGSPHARRLRSLAIGRTIDADELRAIGKLLPGVRALGCTVERLDEEIADVLLGLRLARLDLRSFASEPKALARIAAAPLDHLGLAGSGAELDLVMEAGPIRAPSIALAGWSSDRLAELMLILDEIRPRALALNLDEEASEWLPSWPGAPTLEELEMTGAPLRRGWLPAIRRLEGADLAARIDMPLVEKLLVQEIDVDTALAHGLLRQLISDRVPPGLAAAAPERLVRVAPDPAGRWPDFRRWTWPV
jgi:uncharacterized protein (TIGR02996 family)